MTVCAAWLIDWAHRLAALQKQCHSMSWVQAISGPVLRFWQNWASPDSQVWDLKGLHYQPSEEQHSASHSSGQFLSWLHLPIQLLGRVLEANLRTLFHRPVASTFYAQLVLFIGIEDLCMNEWPSEFLQKSKPVLDSWEVVSGKINEISLLEQQQPQWSQQHF